MSLINITANTLDTAILILRLWKWGTDRLGNLTNVMQLVNDEVKTQIHIFFTLKCMLFTLCNTAKP